MAGPVLWVLLCHSLWRQKSQSLFSSREDQGRGCLLLLDLGHVWGSWSKQQGMKLQVLSRQLR